MLGGIGDVRGGGNFLREDAALKVLAAGADAARLNEEGNRIEQAEVGAADGVIDGGAVVIDAQAGVRSVGEGALGHVETDLRHGGVVVQAGGGGGLKIVRILHVFTGARPVVVVSAVEGELMRVEDNLAHEQAVGGVQLGKLGCLEGHMVAVHIEAVIGGAAEEIGAVGIDAGDDDNVDLVEQGLVSGIVDKVVDHHERAFTGGRLVGVDLRLIPDVQLAVALDDLGGLGERGVRGDLGGGEECQGEVILVVRGRTGGVEVHNVGGLVHLLQESHHLVLRGELVGGVLAVEGGRRVALRSDGERSVDLLRPEDEHAVAGIHFVRIGGLFGLDGRLVAVAAELAADDGELLRARGQVGLGHVEELENVIVARAVNVVGIGAGLGDGIAAVGLGLDRFELLEDFFLCGIAVCGVALVDFETDDLGGVVVGGIVKFQFCAFLCCERAGHQHRDDHRESQQTAQGSLHHFSHSFFSPS